MDDIARMPEHVQRQVGAQLRAQPSQQSLRDSPLTETAVAPKLDRRRVRGAIATIVGGIKFPSKLEGERWAYHRRRQEAGEIRVVHRQVWFDLPGPMRYVCDFAIVENDGRIWYEDAKGFQTDVSRMKLKQVRDIYGIEVRLWPVSR